MLRLNEISGVLCTKQDQPKISYRRSKNDKYFEVTFNNPALLNPINDQTGASQREKIELCDKNKTQVVVFKGAGGKSFCIGGDIKNLSKIIRGETKSTISNDPMSYLAVNFRLPYVIFKMKAMQIFIWDGYVMGLGATLCIGGSTRIATEKTVYANPEAKLGYYTDVGGGYSLSRIRNSIGMYLGLTGSSLKGEDVVKLGIANYFVESKHITLLKKSIENFVSENNNLSQNEIETKIHDLIKKYHKKVDGLIPNEELINEIFNQKTLEKILQKLKEKSSNCEFSKKTLKEIQSLNPLTPSVIFEQITRHKNFTLKDALISDFRIAYRFTKSNDFSEGVRCLLIDKGDQPRWKYKSLDQISKEIVESHFEIMPDEKDLEW